MTGEINEQYPPGPSGGWLLGSVPEVKRDPTRFYLRMREEHGDVIRMRSLPGSYWYFIAHPAGVEQILQTNQQNYIKAAVFKNTFGMLLGQGLFTSDGDHWRRQRRLAQPAFHRQRIAALGSIMTEATERMLSHWDELQLRNEPFDISAEMARLTLEIAGRTLFSVNISEEANRFGNALKVAFDYINQRISSPITLPLFIPTLRNRKFVRAKRILDEVVFNIIRERRRQNVDTGDLLSMLMLTRDEESGEGMSDEQLRDEILTILIAGHETSATALSWTWYVLAKHPEVTAKLRAELDQVLQGRVPRAEDLPKLSYTRMILEEVMRLYPPAWIMMRQTRGWDRINNYTIPPKALIVISQYVTHRHPSFWEQPDKFKPERFMPEQVNSRHRFAYFPFGGGARQCMGNNFALMEAQLLLATIAQRFYPQLVSGERVKEEAAFTLRPKGGLVVAL